MSRVNCRGFDDLSRRLEKVAKEMVDKVKAANGKRIAVGIDSSARYPNEKKVSEVARIIEYGTKSMAPRPFMRVACSENGAKWNRMLAEKCAEVLKGKEINYTSALLSVGKIAADDIREKIVEMDADDTGHLRDSITERVRSES